MKKIILILLLGLCGVLITGFEINQIKAAHSDALIPVVVLKETLGVGAIITDENLEIMGIHEDLAVENTYTKASEVVGMTLAIGLPKGTILNKMLITEQTFFTPAKGHSITALKLNPEAIMCWEVTDGEVVELVHVSLEGQLSRIGKVTVKGFYDQALTHRNNLTSQPVFVLVEGDSHIIDDIIRFRDNGRIEVTKSQ